MLFFNDLMILSVFKLKDVGGGEKKKQSTRKAVEKSAHFLNYLLKIKSNQGNKLQMIVYDSVSHSIAEKFPCFFYIMSCWASLGKKKKKMKYRPESTYC